MKYFKTSKPLICPNILTENILLTKYINWKKDKETDMGQTQEICRKLVKQNGLS